jgi:hypothetical protein
MGTDPSIAHTKATHPSRARVLGEREGAHNCIGEGESGTPLAVREAASPIRVL